jgi:hypothetical protein
VACMFSLLEANRELHSRFSCRLGSPSIQLLYAGRDCKTITSQHANKPSNVVSCCCVLNVLFQVASLVSNSSSVSFPRIAHNVPKPDTHSRHRSRSNQRVYSLHAPVFE